MVRYFEKFIIYIKTIKMSIYSLQARFFKEQDIDGKQQF